MTDWAPAAAEIRRRYRLDKWVCALDDLPLTGSARGEPLPLPMRVEMFWRRENFQPVVQMNLIVIRRLRLSLDISALERALTLLVQRHEPLRSELLLVDGHPAQRIVPDSAVDLDMADLSSVGEAERGAEVARQMYAFAQQNIELFSGPTFRVKLLRVGESEYVLGLLLHHYFGDAKSLQVIFSDLLSLYASIERKRESGLPVLRRQYADYALWQRNFAAPRLEEYLAYWGTRLADVPWLGPSVQGEPDRKRTAMTQFALPADLSARLGGVARQAKSTMFAVCLAAYQLALATFSGRNDIVTAVPVAARARRDFAETVGYLMNALPIHSHVDPAASVQEHLKAFSQKLMADYFRQDVSYELLEEFLPGPQPLSTNMFNFIPMAFSRPHPDFGANEIEGYTHPAFEKAMQARPRVRVMKDFVFFLNEEAVGLSGIILYNPDYLDDAATRRLIAHFTEQLERIAGSAL